MHPQTLKIAQFKAKAVSTQMAPDSTFKIALSLMAFDAEIMIRKPYSNGIKPPKEWRSGTAIIHQRRGCNFLFFAFARNNPKKLIK
ncbi:penicillin-binding transpeptidase domain-containing protein [Klebsiella pneumoniae]|uniref:penicillin-binding transpeptidase domain-containing protein n=1 Tax=Klebsiella pneumoniae TaxID=573 RepID=UPI00388F4F65